MTTRLKALLTLAALTLLALPGIAQAAGCPNEEFRTGPSASLPDCRAYELVTPEELGRTQAITFTESDYAILSADGEHLALRTFAPLEPEPSLAGTRAVFSRTAQGWTAKSIVSPEVAAREITVTFPEVLFSSDLSQIAFEAEPTLNQEERENEPTQFEVGPVGGPYTVMAEAPKASGFTAISGANAGTTSVPAFNDVLFESRTTIFLPPGPERAIAEEAASGPSLKAFNCMIGRAGRCGSSMSEAKARTSKNSTRAGAAAWEQGTEPMVRGRSVLSLRMARRSSSRAVAVCTCGWMVGKRWKSQNPKGLSPNLNVGR